MTEETKEKIKILLELVEFKGSCSSSNTLNVSELPCPLNTGDVGGCGDQEERAKTAQKMLDKYSEEEIFEALI